MSYRRNLFFIRSGNKEAFAQAWDYTDLVVFEIGVTVRVH